MQTPHRKTPCLSRDSVAVSLDQSSVSVIKHLARALKEGRSTDVSLNHCKLGDEAVKSLCSFITHSSLHTLNLDHCSLTGSCLTVLSSALTSSLSELRNLVQRRTRLGDDTLQTLSQTLQSDRCKLNTLSMNACELTEPVFSALGSVLVCETSRLKELNVGVNRVGDAAAKHIWKELKHPYCQLQHLDLEMVKLTDACVDELCDAVMACGSLTNLILKNNKLTDVSVPRLVELVRDRPVLQLNVQYNDFSEDVLELMDPYETIQY